MNIEQESNCLSPSLSLEYCPEKQNFGGIIGELELEFTVKFPHAGKLEVGEQVYMVGKGKFIYQELSA